MRKLSEFVSINSNFQRAMRLDSDYSSDSDASISHYIPQESSINILRSMACHIKDSNQCAFTWTGPYGSGKSSLALLLCSLVGGGKARNVALKRLQISNNDPIVEVFSQSLPWNVIPITGRQTRLIDDMAKHLQSKADEGHVVTAFSKLSEKNKNSLIIIDELGKYLEAENSTENTYLLQELAEVANRSQHRIILVGILHQAMDVYASRLPQQLKNEWEKVKGRFVDMPLLGSSEEVINLLGRAIQTNEKIQLTYNKTDSCMAVAEDYALRRQLGRDRASRVSELLKAVWPINPVLAILLGPISRRKFSQNERSIYSFLNSREPFGFQEFISNHCVLDVYGPANYFDYLKSNFEASILSSPDGHRWMTAITALERAERKATVKQILLVKSLALIDLFKFGSGIGASLPVLAAAINESLDTVKELIKDLISWKIAIYRNYDNAYAIFEGSDFNLEEVLSKTIGQQNGIDIDQIKRLLELSPIVARDVYMRMGTLRWMERVVVPQESLQRFVSEKSGDDGATGVLVLIIPNDQEERSPAEIIKNLLQSNVNATKVFVYGVPEKWEQIRSRLIELQSLHQVAKSPELEGDEVGRKEVLARTEKARDQLIEQLSEAFSNAVWGHPAINVRYTKRYGDLAAIVSDVANSVFEDVPMIRNELINRDYLSTNITSARKSLMHRMLTHENQKNLGYEKYPPEYALYLCMLKAIHKRGSDGKWKFNTDLDTEVYQGFWKKTDELIQRRGTISMQELYDEWRRPPYGLRYGPMPILALVYCLSHCDQIAVYQNKTFIPEIGSEVIDEWLIDPESIDIRYFCNNNTQKERLCYFASIIGKYSGEKYDSEPLTVGRALVKLFLSSPKLSQHSTAYTKNTNSLKQKVLKASDPIKLLFDDIEAIYGNDENKIERGFAESLREYTTAMPGVIDKTYTLLMKALNTSSESLSKLRERAISVKGLSGKMILEAFIARLEKFEGSESDIEGLIGLTAAKPSFMWTDNDINAAHTKLIELAYEFRKLEAQCALRGRPSNRTVFNVVFGNKNNDLSESFDLSDDEQTEACNIAKDLAELLKGKNSSVALAALAETGLTIKQTSREKND